MKALLVSLLLPLFATAQHCPYDGSSVIVVRPHMEGDNRVIDGLRITLLDSNNVPMSMGGRPYAPFIRNTDRMAWDAPDVGHLPELLAEHLFPFAEDNYVLVLGRSIDLHGCSVLVQDERDRDAGPQNAQRYAWLIRYEQIVAPLTAHDCYSLCGQYDEEVYPPREGRPNYAPVDIILYPR